MNKELLIRVRDCIAKYPEHFNMSEWIVTENQVATNIGSVPNCHFCGTTACIAGWAWLLYHNDQDPLENLKSCDEKLKGFKSYEVKDILGLKDQSLFHTSDWEDGYAIPDYRWKALSSEEQSRKAVEYINHLLEKEEDDKPVENYY